MLSSDSVVFSGPIYYRCDHHKQFIVWVYRFLESAYQCALNALADKIHRSDIEEVTVPLGRNHGLVLSHLVDVLRDHSPPYDATLRVEAKDDE